jgi:hypothetical protein
MKYDRYQLLAGVEALERFENMVVDTPPARVWRRNRMEALTWRLTDSLGINGMEAAIAASQVVGFPSPEQKKDEIEKARLRIIDYFLVEHTQQISRRQSIETKPRRGLRYQILAEDSIAHKETIGAKIRRLLSNGHVHSAVGFVAIAYWIISLLPLVKAKIAQRLPGYSTLIEFGLWAITLLAYLLFMIKVGTGLSSTLKDLISEKKDKGDKSEQAIAS